MSHIFTWLFSYHTEDMLITGGSSHCFYFVLFLANNLEIMIIFVYHEVTTVLDLAVELSSQKSCHSTELEASKKVEHLELQMHGQGGWRNTAKEPLLWGKVGCFSFHCPLCSHK